jgi:hypothetical protein
MTKLKRRMMLVFAAVAAAILSTGTALANPTNSEALLTPDFPLTPKELRAHGLFPPATNASAVDATGKFISDFTFGNFHYHIVSRYVSSSWLITQLEAKWVHNANAPQPEPVPESQLFPVPNGTNRMWTNEQGTTGTATPMHKCTQDNPGICGGKQFPPQYPAPSDFPRPVGTGTPGISRGQHYPNYEGAYDVIIEYKYAPNGDGRYSWHLSKFEVTTHCGGGNPYSSACD